MQQYLPFTVLKRDIDDHTHSSWTVATVLTVYGIETEQSCFINLAILFVATVLTVYGIETHEHKHYLVHSYHLVATVLTVYGIETDVFNEFINVTCDTLLQQYLPFTVLKLLTNEIPI